MNRSLTIPAVCCLVAFAVLLVILHGAVGRENAAKSAKSSELSGADERRTMLSAHAYTSSQAAHVNAPEGSHLLSAKDAQQHLTTLSGEYLRPWRQWETSPRRLYSRMAPRPIPSISAEVAMSSGTTGESGSFLLATIVVRTGEHSQPVPCVVDRISKRVWLCSEGQWLTEEEWLKLAPSP